MGILDGVEHDVSAVIGGVEHWAGDMETLVEHAVSQVALIGGAGFGDVNLLVEFLIKEGEDPVAVISALISHISSIGGDVAGTLEEITHGVLVYGLIGFLKMKVEQALAPIKETLQQNIARGQMVADVHHTTLTTMQAKLDVLRSGSNASGMAWQGQSVDAMSTQFAYISNFINQLSDQIQHDGTQARLNQAFIIVLEGIGLIAAGLAIVDILLVIASAVVTVSTEGVGIVLFPIDAAVIGAQLVFLLELVAADCLIWLLGTLAIYVIHHPIQLSGATVHPIVTHVPQGAQLPEPRKLTDAEKQEVQAIIDELTALGFKVNSAWIEYLMRLLGEGMSAKEAGAVIRCMFGKGYLPQSITGKQPTKIQSAIQSAWNNIVDHFKPRDLEGTWKDYHPDRVDYPKGGLPSGAKHIDEVGNAIKSIENLLMLLEDAITNPKTPEGLRGVYQNLYDTFQNTLDYVNARVYGSKPPLNWSDPKGEIPFGDDLIEKSGCKP